MAFDNSACLRLAAPLALSLVLSGCWGTMVFGTVEASGEGGTAGSTGMRSMGGTYSPGGQAGTAGGSREAGGGQGGPEAPPTLEPLELVQSNQVPGGNDWGIQGFWYGFGDGASCNSTKNVCSGWECCVEGTTQKDPLYNFWGCGFGLTLNQYQGTKLPYAGPAKGFEVRLQGDTGGLEVRVSFNQVLNPDHQPGPYFTIGPGRTRVLFSDAEYPAWCATAGTCQGLPREQAQAHNSYDIEFMVAGGTRETPYHICVTSLKPFL